MINKSNFLLFAYQFETPVIGFSALNELTQNAQSHVIDFCLLPTGQGYGLVANADETASSNPTALGIEAYQAKTTASSRLIVDSLMYLHPKPEPSHEILWLESQHFVNSVKWLETALIEYQVQVIEFRTPRTLNSIRTQALLTLPDLKQKSNVMDAAQKLNINLSLIKLNANAAREFFFN